MFIIHLEVHEEDNLKDYPIYNTKLLYLILVRISKKLNESNESQFSTEIFKILFECKIEGEIKHRNDLPLQLLYDSIHLTNNIGVYGIQRILHKKINLLPSKITIIEGPFGSGKTRYFEFMARNFKGTFYYYLPFKLLRSYKRIKYELDMVKSMKHEFANMVVFFDDFDYLEDSPEREKTLKFIIKHYDTGMRFIITTTKEIRKLSILDLFPLTRIKIGIPDQQCLFEMVSSTIVQHSNSPTVISEIVDSLVGLYIGEVEDVLNKALFLNKSAETDGKELVLKIRDIVRFYRKTNGGSDTEQLNNNNRETRCIYGYKHEKEHIHSIIEYPSTYKDFYKELKLKQTKGILLFGPPGCSKTTIVKEIAAHGPNKNKYFVHIKGSEFYNKYVGKSEQKLSEVFTLARRYSPSILFFDEIDSIASPRDNADKACSRILGQLLVELDGITGLNDVVFIAATNNPDKIDSALLRKGRIDEIIYLGPPNETSRFEIMENFMDADLLYRIDKQMFVKLTKKFTGAEMEFLIHEINSSGLEGYKEIIKRQTLVCTKSVLKYYKKWNKKFNS